MKVIIGLCLVFFSNFAFSGSGSGGVRIEHVGTFNGNNIVFFCTDQVADKPECNTFHDRWTINLDTEVGKAQYSLILAAQAAGSVIRVNGLNTCNLWSNSEDVH